MIKYQNLIDEWIELNKNGLTLKEIAKKYKVHPQTISRNFYKKNIKVKKRYDRNKKYTYNENCFNQLNEQSCYFLGYLFADGCLLDKTFKCVKLTLALEDINILEKFKLFLGTNAPILTYRSNKGFYNSTVRINNIKIYNKLKELKLEPRKSLILKFPDYLPDEMLSHFMRGFFDGDGCICLKNGKIFKYLHLNLVSSYDFLFKYREILEKKCSINRRKIIKRDNIYLLDITRKRDLLKIKDFLYKNATIYLERKKNKFFTDINLKSNCSSKYRGVCFNKKDKVWIATYYNNEKRTAKYGFKTEEEAWLFLQDKKYCKTI